jgi:glutaredoxin-related protein
VAVVLDALAEESENYRVNFEKERRVWFMKVKNIIEESPIVLFMLGTPESHRQDDSTGKVVGLLRRYGVEYTHYNVG